jgi:lipopolysaccharide/colanic/teichoic acid biosynthesis glycosyltransferase
MLKRFFDLVFSAFGLLIIWPFFLLIAFLIKIDSVGPVFFRQVRVGRYLCPFKIHKFRTMVVNASDIGPSVTTDVDPRVTRVGKILRKYKLDELPQLIDVFLGDMSLVGPRPEVPKYVDAYSEIDKRVIFSVKPGITDKASIEFRNENELIANVCDADRVYIEKILPCKLQYYHEYVETHSLWLDIKIIFKTAWLTLPFNSNK